MDRRRPTWTWLPQSSAAWCAVAYGVAASVALIALPDASRLLVVSAFGAPFGWLLGAGAVAVVPTVVPEGGAATETTGRVVVVAYGLGMFLNGYLWGHVVTVVTRRLRRRVGTPVSAIPPTPGA